MADTYDVIICGAGSGGGFLAGEIASDASVLLLDAGPHIGGAPRPGFGSAERRRFSTQINLGLYIPDGVNSKNQGLCTFQYPLYADESNPAFAGVTREARVVGGGSFINVGAWVRPRAVDWAGFEEATGVVGWTKEAFEPHFQKAERILTVHRDKRENWNPASVLYETTAVSMGIPVFENASNRSNCIFCGQRVNAGVPCKYDALMSTAITQIPKAIENGTQLVDNATVTGIQITNGKATGITYIKDGQTITANARKLVVLAAGAIGTPLILFNSDIHLINPNVGKYLKAHPGTSVEAFMPGGEWNSDRGYQWNCFHYGMHEDQPVDTIVFLSTSFPTTPWLAAQVDGFGKPYKDLMRRFRYRIGAWIFALKPNISGRVLGRVHAPVVRYSIITTDGLPEPKLLNDVSITVRQVAEVFQRMGATFTEPNPNQPEAIFRQGLALRLPAAGIFHSQGSCRAGSDPGTSVVNSNCMSHDIENLMICDASVIPNHIGANSNAMVMAVASRAADFVKSQVLDRASADHEGQ
ncbi:MAG: GMC family oxidoreductase [Acidobacteria bacterium]|nr:GMC family oxidoreductase [Acidobacteriota bacterium]